MKNLLILALSAIALITASVFASCEKTEATYPSTEATEVFDDKNAHVATTIEPKLTKQDEVVTFSNWKAIPDVYKKNVSDIMAYSKKRTSRVAKIQNSSAATSALLDFLQGGGTKTFLTFNLSPSESNCFNWGNNAYILGRSNDRDGDYSSFGYSCANTTTYEIQWDFTDSEGQSWFVIDITDINDPVLPIGNSDKFDVAIYRSRKLALYQPGSGNKAVTLELDETLFPGETPYSTDALFGLILEYMPISQVLSPLQGLIDGRWDSYHGAQHLFVTGRYGPYPNLQTVRTVRCKTGCPAL